MGNPFFTFPLAVLAMPLDEKEILHHIVCHGVERAGQGARAEEIDGARIDEHLQRKADGYRKCRTHDQVVRGAIICEVALAHIPSTLHTAEAVSRFVKSHEAVHGKGPLVFVAAQLLWDCKDGTLKFREFSTLCAINSIIGFKKRPVLIRRGMIIARQLGYKTPAVMNQELPKSRTARKPLTTQQLRDCLDRLENRELIMRCHPRKKSRSVFFSTTLDREALRQGVKVLLEKKALTQASRESDRQFFAADEKNQNRTRKDTLNKEFEEAEKEPVKKGENQNGTRTEPEQEPEGEPVKEELPNKSFKQELSKEERSTVHSEILRPSFSEIRNTFDSLDTEPAVPSVESPPAAPTVSFSMPTQADAVAQAKATHIKATADMGATWWAQYGSDERWRVRDWRKDCLGFVLDSIAKQQRKAI